MQYSAAGDAAPGRGEAFADEDAVRRLGAV
jgi:hypothetical protein